MRSRLRRRNKPQFLLPFLVLVSLGVVFILIFQLWGFFFPNNKGDAVLYIAEGRASVLPFGKHEWENTYNGAKVKLGDAVKMQTGSKGVVSFYDGTVLRMDANAEITLIDITKKSDYQEILLNLNRGSVWVNKPTKNVIRKTDFVINTDNASYSITGTVFDLSKQESLETLRVIKGQVQADIIEKVDGRNRVIESIQVASGQEINLDKASMQAFYQRQSPSVLKAIAADFKEGVWYLWNMAEDDEPTNFADGETARIIVPEDNEDDGEDLETNSDELSNLDAPTISQPQGGALNTDSATQTIKGKAVAGTQKVLVKQLLAGETDETKVLINGFDPNDLSFSYELSTTKGNIKSGTNIYRFVGVDENARETKAVEVEITFNQSGSEDSVTELDEDDDSNSNAGSSSTTKPLSKPVATTVSGQKYQSGMEVNKDIVISGTVEGAEKVFVNDYQLSQFSAGSTAWSYNARVSLDNLKAGENKYEVYAVDKDGKKSAVLEVVINYKAPEKQPEKEPEVNEPEVKEPETKEPEEKTPEDSTENSDANGGTTNNDSNTQTPAENEDNEEKVPEIPQGF